MIPPRDRTGQVSSYKNYLEQLLSTRVRGMWVPERVWEQTLIPDLVAAGMDYTVLDDYHFKQAGLEEDQLFGYAGRVFRTESLSSESGCTSTNCPSIILRSFWIDRPLGVNHLAVVILSA